VPRRDARIPHLPEHPVVLVTGCSSGIGLALAHRLAGWSAARIVLTARERSLAVLEREGLAPDDRIMVLPLDVVDLEQRRRVVAAVEARFGGVDVLINNAGVAYRSVAEHLTPHDAFHQMATNFLGPMDLVRLVLPHMRRRRFGRILNVSSVSGMMAMPTMGAYSASKFALEGASESMWYEMRPWNVHVTLVQPGLIRSDSFRNTRLSAGAQRAESDPEDPYAPVYGGMGPFIGWLMSHAVSTPDDVARRILATLERRHPPLRVSATLDARFFYLMRRLLPRRIYHAVLYALLPHVRHRRSPHDA
jgi:NAD(P)-dependent dehydrogenase (short-subunit alcohol dehydrogenase family)